ncbi:hypothetical protein LEP1GSC081_4294 [Leptospira kirschneri str. H1]|uniref:Uncharacterized protein n=1 Tax=Leptospira kirschneri str. H1 TaxID=1049966 RepID=A0A0E2B9S4_9LEPT|nr:hypothetical protein [Leptospira kirschneri]EKO17650.1 hypothetical protein LEP1GSC081_4294 [Leptospira kirschneri str. H1]
MGKKENLLVLIKIILRDETIKKKMSIFQNTVERTIFNPIGKGTIKNPKGP